MGDRELSLLHGLLRSGSLLFLSSLRSPPMYDITYPASWATQHYGLSAAGGGGDPMELNLRCLFLSFQNDLGFAHSVVQVWVHHCHWYLSFVMNVYHKTPFVGLTS